MVQAPGAIVQLVEQPINYTKFKGSNLAAAGNSWPQLKVAERQ
jgi:hypothetical protein